MRGLGMGEAGGMGAFTGKSYAGEGSASSEKLEKLFGDQREDRLTSSEVCYRD